MDLTVYSAEINLDLTDPDAPKFVKASPNSSEVTVDAQKITIAKEGVWVILLGFAGATDPHWLTLHWKHGALATTIKPDLIIITSQVVANSTNKYPFSVSYVAQGVTHVFDPTIADDPPGT